MHVVLAAALAVQRFRSGERVAEAMFKGDLFDRETKTPVEPGMINPAEPGHAVVERHADAYFGSSVWWVRRLPPGAL